MHEVQELRHLTRPSEAPMVVQSCATFLCRLRGLMFRRSLPPNWGLLFVLSKESRLDAAIHMLWMAIDIAVIWIDASGVVVDARPAYRWRSILVPSAPAKYILETSIEQLHRFNPGDELLIEGHTDH